MLKRSWLLLPCVSLVTLVLLVGSAEILARSLFPENGSTMPCLIVNDPSTGVRGLPNSVCHETTFEGLPIEYRFNDCGFRNDERCGPAPQGTYRIVLIGSSMTEGLRVDRERSYAGLLASLLTRAAGRNVDVFNEGLQWSMPASWPLRLKAIADAKPDLIVWTMTPLDIDSASLILPYVPGVQDAVASSDAAADRVPSAVQAGASAPRRSAAALAARAWDKLIGPINQTRTAQLLQSLLFVSPSLYLHHVEMQGRSADYLRTPLPSSFRDSLHTVDKALGPVTAEARALHVPLVVVLTPQRADAIMLAQATWAPGYDPLALNRALAAVVRRRGAVYLDISHGFKDLTDPGTLYLPFDGHMTARGHAVVADLLTKGLTQRGFPGLSRVASSAQ